MGKQEKRKNRKKKDWGKRIVSGLTVSALLLAGGQSRLQSGFFIEAAAQEKASIETVTESAVSNTQKEEIKQTIAAYGENLDDIEPDADGFLIADGIFFGYEGEAECITLPDTVTGIQGEAFSVGAPNVKKVTIKHSLSTLERDSFASESLQEIVFHCTMEQLPQGVFSQCKSLKKVTLPDGLKEIPKEAFWGVDCLTDVSIPEGTETIGASAFDGCAQLVDLKLPNSLTEIQEAAFYGCKKLEQVAFPESLQRIGDEAFLGCESLVAAHLPEKLESLGKMVFYNCDLKQLYIPGCVKQVTFRDFYGVSGTDNQDLETIVLAEGVEEVEELVFYGSTQLQSVVFPHTLKRLGENCFGHCNQLTEVSIPSGELLLCAFSSCEQLQRVTIGHGVRRMEGTFSGCGALTELNMEPGITVIGADTFEENRLTEVSIPNTVTYIGQDAFLSQTLEQVLVPPDSLKYVDGTAFSGTPWYKKLEEQATGEKSSYVIQENVMLGVTQCFYDEASEPQEIPSDVTVLGRYQTAQGNVKISDKIIGISSFYGSDQLKEVEMPDSVTMLGDFAFADNRALERISLSNYLTALSWGMFQDCVSLKEVKLPENLVSIETAAFERCTALEELELPATVERIGAYAFRGCQGMKSLVIPASVTQIGQDAFSDMADDFTLIGEAGSYAQKYAGEQGISFQVQQMESTVSVSKMHIDTVQTSGQKKTQLQDMQTGGAYTVTLDPMDGIVETQELVVQNGDSYAKLPAAGKDGAIFIGWYTSPVEGEGIKIENSTIVNLESNQILYAHYASRICQVTFHGEGGSMQSGSQEKSVIYGETYGELPTMYAEDGRTFLGWFTAQDGGTQITEDMVVSITGQQELYAHWTSAYASISLETLSYEFGNSLSGFGYDKKVNGEGKYYIPLGIYQYIFGDTVFAKNAYENTGAWSGNCFGMTASSLFFNESQDDVEVTDFQAGAKSLSDLAVGDVSSKTALSLTQFIEALQVTQKSSRINEILCSHMNRLDEICQKAACAEKQTGYPIIICMFGEEGGHAVIGYKLEGEKLYVYDPNFPMTERYLCLKKTDGMVTEWSYKVNDQYDWGTQNPNSFLSYVSYEDFLEQWNGRKAKTYQKRNLVSVNVEEAVLYDSDQNMVGKVQNGKFISYNPDYEAVIDPSVKAEQNLECEFYVPKGTVYIKNATSRPDMTVKVTGTKQSMNLTTQVDLVKVELDERSENVQVSVEPKKSQRYDITLQSEGEEDVKMTGSGTGTHTISAMQTLQGIAFERDENSEVRIGNNKVELVEIKASASAGGSVSRQGNKSILKNRNAVYAATPEYGYMVDDVKIDGTSKGNISAFTFLGVNKNHTVDVSFKRASFERAQTRAVATVRQGEVPKLLIKIGKQTLTEKNDYVASILKETDSVMTLQIQGKNSYDKTEMVVEVNRISGNTRQISWGLDGKQYETVTDPNQEQIDPSGSTADDQMETAPPTQNGASVTNPPTDRANASLDASKGENETIYMADDLLYRIRNEKNRTVSVCGVNTAKKKVKIPARIKIRGTQYSVTKIDPNVWSDDETIKEICIGKNMTQIGQKAFAGAENLKRITFQGTALQSVGKQALKGISERAVIRVPKTVKKQYRKLLKGKGQKKTVKVKEK